MLGAADEVEAGEAFALRADGAAASRERLVVAGRGE